MASNKFFTIMVVPEKSNRVAKLVIPSYVFKGGIIALAFLGVLATIMVLDYANVMNQINENKQLKVENRLLRQSVQVFKTKMVTIENTLDRVKTFVTKLRIITNIEDNSVPLQPGLPPSVTPANAPGDSAPGTGAPQESRNDIGTRTQALLAHDDRDTDVGVGHEEDLITSPAGERVLPAGTDDPGDGLSTPSARNARVSYEAARERRATLLAALMNQTPSTFVLSDADNSQFVKSEFQKLDAAYGEVNLFALDTERETQDILEKLGEKRAMLASTPTRIPTLGYITSDYGVRISPYDGRRKMHEGIDIANRFGAQIIAPADGVITFAGVKPGYGKMVIIDHGNGIETRYAHASKSHVNAGDRVQRGQLIASVGSSGHSTGPHCHYEVHANGLPVDPCWYILDHPGLCRR